MKIMTIFKTGILMDKAINKIAIPKKIKFKYHLLIDLKYIIGLIIFGIILYQFGSVFTIRRLPFLIAFLIFILISGIFNIFKSIEDIAIIKYLVNNHFINLDNEE